MSALATAAGLLLSGCAIPLHAGPTTHHLIIGLGVVSTNETPHAAVVTNMTAFGISASDRPGFKFAVGYASSAVVAVPDEAEDVRVEVIQRPFGPLRVTAPRAVLSRH
ncbi:MAG: hypothetical protein M9894_30655 [Planctomycetes bacterium]|nr:hypothetical protein [Planctomycetota bacterium]